MGWSRFKIAFLASRNEMTRRWLSSLLLFGTLISAMLFVVSPTVAFASETYATADWETGSGTPTHAPQNQGGYADMYIASGSVSDWSTQNGSGHINQTIWVSTDDQTNTGTYWVEAGYTYGFQGSNVLTYYWAHQSPTYGYGGHQITSITPTVGNWEPIEIAYSGNSTWDIYYNWSTQTGSYGSSAATGNALWSYGLEAGLESTNTNNKLTNAQLSGLEWLDPNSVWQTGWDTTNNASSLLVDSPAYAKWGTQYKSITDGQ